tara:strand:+ start:966 stop:1163 length:198 start_codon:yes stop_codon:yes gene_type:complete
MTRKDYIKIAEIIKDEYQHEVARCGADVPTWSVVESIADQLAAYMAADNPRFDREKFVTACYGRN